MMGRLANLAKRRGETHGTTGVGKEMGRHEYGDGPSSPHTYRILQEFAKKYEESIPDTLDRAIEEVRRARILKEAADAYAAIAADPVEDAAWRAEIAAWDATLLDGLEPEPELMEGLEREPEPVEVR